MASPEDPKRARAPTVDPKERPYYRTGGPVPRPRSALPGLLIGVVVALMCAGGLYFAYTKVSNRQVASETVPLIRADQGATKVKPDQPGGEAAPDQDSSAYNPGGDTSTKTERLLPPPEQPMAKPVAPPEPEPLPTQNIAVAPMPQAAPATPAPPPSSSPQPSVLTPPPGTKTAQVATPAATPAAVPTAPPATPKPAPPPPAAAPPAPTPAPAAGAFRIQIAATTDDAAAHKTWDGLQKAHPDLLGSLSLTVVRADLGDKGIFFRVQAGPLADRPSADKLCGQLKAISIGCIIVKAQ